MVEERVLNQIFMSCTARCGVQQERMRVEENN